MSRILLADHSAHAQRLGERILSEEGYQVVTVSDGDTALFCLEDVDPDLVIASVSLPKRTGYDLCSYVRMNPRHRHTRFILTAGLQDTLDEALVKRAGADTSIRKPFEASALLEAVRPLLEMAAADRGDRPERPGTASRPGLPSSPPTVALVEPERVRAAVTVALDASMPKLIEEITGKVLLAPSTQPQAKSTTQD